MNSSKDIPDDLLDRALATMRNQPVFSDFPAERVLRNISASCTPRQQQTFDPRNNKTIKAFFKVAAAVFLTLALLAVFLGRKDGAGVVFADVAHQIAEAQTMSFDLQSHAPGAAPTPVKAMFRQSGHYRFEHDGVISIRDTAAGVLLILSDKEKTAYPMHIKGDGSTTAPSSAQNDWFAMLKRISNAPGKPMGEEKIDGVKARGFEVIDRGQYWQRFLVWADARSGAPLRVEVLPPDGASRSPLVTLDHIKLGVPLPESLFSTDAPAGYRKQVSTIQLPTRAGTEQDLIDLLRAYGQRNGGRFPIELGVRSMPRIAAALRAPNTQPDADQVTTQLLVSYASGFLAQIKGKWGYAGATTRMGDAAQPLFWYQPESSARDRVIYADLHISDADPADLPEATHTSYKPMQPASAPSIEPATRSSQ